MVCVVVMASGSLGLHRKRERWTWAATSFDFDLIFRNKGTEGTEQNKREGNDLGYIFCCVRVQNLKEGEGGQRIPKYNCFRFNKTCCFYIPPHQIKPAASSKKIKNNQLRLDPFSLLSCRLLIGY